MLDVENTAGALPIRVIGRIRTGARPVLGWMVLLVCMILSGLPAVAIQTNRWVDLERLNNVLILAGPLGVLCVWTLWGWRHPRPWKRTPWRGLGALLLGSLILSQLLLGWLPGTRPWIVLVSSGNYMALLNHVTQTFVEVAGRFELWWRGVTRGGAGQDNLVFAVIGATVFFVFGVVTAWLARRTRQGLLTGAPILWLLGMTLLYSSGGRLILVAALAFTLFLQLILDHERLQSRWESMHLDYSPSLLVDRITVAIGTLALILTLAAVTPNLYWEALVTRYYGLLSPWTERIEDLGERIFPELRGTSRLRGAGDGSGMPNDFLLRGGPDLGSEVVMQVRTDETARYEYAYDELGAPPGHYMRGRTFMQYEGNGWASVRNTDRTEVEANTPWREPGWGRKRVVQSVIMETRSSVLFAAPEPIELSVGGVRGQRSDEDMVALSGRARSYTVVSAVPAVNEAMLRDLGRAEDFSLPAALEGHRELPDSVTDRTVDLAQEITADADTAFDKAAALEAYLRQYTYDLEVPAPPADVDDVADYFLFDLQRGYCDYYATAFVVMARAMGLPTRFATGYAVGRWNPMDGVWTITEAEAHSWPEVYFPEVGWIAFEPTAGRSTLSRTAAADTSGSQVQALPPPATTTESEETTPTRRNWQMLFWLLPGMGLVWLAWKGWRVWQTQREDPWTSLLQWGAQRGRRMQEGETALEYGEQLATFIDRHGTANPDASRVARREILALSRAVSRYAYGPTGLRSGAHGTVLEHWDRLRGYLRILRVR